LFELPHEVTQAEAAARHIINARAFLYIPILLYGKILSILLCSI